MGTSSTIIFLNGVSSAGKTSIAKVLQQTLEQPYLHVPIDSFEDMLPTHHERGEAFSFEALFPKMLAGFHRSIAALASAGNNLIVDHVMVYREGWASSLADCLTLLAPYTVYFVGVHCPLDELRRRERARGDRFSGTAERQFPRVHRHQMYDIEVDTSLASAEVCAERIRAFLAECQPLAFELLRQRPVETIP